MKTTYGQRLKAARKAAGLTQKQLAKNSDTSQTVIADLERGRTNGSTATAQIAYALGVNALWLADEIGPREVSVYHMLAMQILMLPPAARKSLLDVIQPFLRQPVALNHVAVHNHHGDIGVESPLSPIKPGAYKSDVRTPEIPHDAE